MNLFGHLQNFEEIEQNIPKIGFVPNSNINNENEGNEEEREMNNNDIIMGENNVLREMMENQPK